MYWQDMLMWVSLKEEDVDILLENFEFSNKIFFVQITVIGEHTAY